MNAKNSGGYTPLMYAAYIGHDNIVNLLIEGQVDVNLANKKGLTPLMLAASCGNESICDFLRDVGLMYSTLPSICLIYELTPDLLDFFTAFYIWCYFAN